MTETIGNNLPHFGFDFLRCDLIGDIPHKTYVEWDEICPRCAEKGIVHHLDWREDDDLDYPYECPACMHRFADRDLPHNNCFSIPCSKEEYESWESLQRQGFYLERRYGTTVLTNITDYWK